MHCRIIREEWRTGRHPHVDKIIAGEGSEAISISIPDDGLEPVVKRYVPADSSRVATSTLQETVEVADAIVEKARAVLKTQTDIAGHRHDILTILNLAKNSGS